MAGAPFNREVRVQVHELPNGERALELAGPPVELQETPGTMQC